MDGNGEKVVLITGGTSGLGLATAVELAACGWSLMLHHAPGAEADQAVAAATKAAEQAETDAEVATVQADLTDPAEREQLIEATMDRFGRIDMLVNASAPPPAEPEDLLEVGEEAYAAVMDARATAAFFLTQRVANEMIRLVENGQIEGPRIVTFNSISAEATSTDHGPQCLSRAALAMITRLFADRLGEHGIGVYEVRVGLMSTGPDDPAHGKYDELIAQGLTPIRRWGQPEDAAQAVVAVAEGLLNFSTGQVLHVDGGFHLRRL